MSVLHLLTTPSSVAAGYELGTGRSVPTAAAVVGLVSVVVGGLALARSARTAALVALVAGPAGAVVGGLHAVNAAGGLGTGNGLAGAVVAVALGLAGTVLGASALVRSRRSGRPVGSAR
ncbi:DUF6223 family protein [Geodermatophilus amargosae]|uniref:DUF6223 family protein n=1 Tax=Geodermatophilus amargosae TaxID=1296565 RepID=UPI0034DFD6A8